MSHYQLNRRQALHAAAAVAVGGSLTKLAMGGGGGPAPTVTVRPSVLILTETSPTIVSYAKGVKEMRARSTANPLDPLGWTFWANIHAIAPGTVGNHPSWDQCDHFTRWFLPWHRGFLMYFERIIRALSGDSNFVLPYWPWEQTAGRAVPELFRMKDHPVLGELFHPRYTWINNGTPLPDSPFTVDLVGDLAEVNYDTNGISDGFNQGLDGSPHGQVHVNVGGDMRQVPTAARDPIFWLHHANVDRMWNQWLAKGGGRKNPTDPQWLGFPINQDSGLLKPMQFPDENGNFSNHTTQQVIDMAKASYRYDDDQPPPAPPINASMTPADTTPQQRSVAGSVSQGSFQLTAAKNVVPVKLGVTGAGNVNRTVKLMMAASAPHLKRQSRVFVEIQGIRVEGRPEVDYSVLLKRKDAPEGQKPEYLGSLNFFGVHSHGAPGAGHGHAAAAEPAMFNRRYDATNAVQKLTNDGEKTVTDFDVIFEPSRREENAPPVTGVTFERIAFETINRLPDPG